MKDSLCWYCTNAVPGKESGGCSWSRFLEPVEGWNAKETKNIYSDYQGKGYDSSFLVEECPCFDPDETWRGAALNRNVIKGKKVYRSYRCLELNRTFSSSLDAAKWVIDMGLTKATEIKSIGASFRSKTSGSKPFKAYGYTWVAIERESYPTDRIGYLITMTDIGVTIDGLFQTAEWLAAEGKVGRTANTIKVYLSKAIRNDNEFDMFGHHFVVKRKREEWKHEQ